MDFSNLLPKIAKLEEEVQSLTTIASLKDQEIEDLKCQLGAKDQTSTNHRSSDVARPKPAENVWREVPRRKAVNPRRMEIYIILLPFPCTTGSCPCRMMEKRETRKEAKETRKPPSTQRKPKVLILADRNGRY